MANNYRNMQNRHALKVLTKTPTMPDPALAVAGDDEMANIPLVIFRDQHLKMPGPITESLLKMPYEKTAVKGAGDTLSMADFETENFDLGAAYDFLI